MKIENMALVFHDADTGKAYCKILTEFEAIIATGLFKDEATGEFKVVAVQPFEIRSVKK